MDQPKNNAKMYRNAIIGVVVFMVLYIFFAIGDVVIKGYSTLSFSPIALGAIVIGVLNAMWLKERKKI